MWLLLEKVVVAMAALRLLSGLIEMSAGLVMLKLNDIEKALVVNTSLALVGPIILIATTTIGLLGMVEKLSLGRLAWIVLGVAFILIGVKSR